MFIYACHDSTLVGLLGTLDIFDFTWPPFGADIRLELYENRAGKQFIRVSYCGQVDLKGSLYVSHIADRQFIYPHILNRLMNKTI